MRQRGLRAGLTLLAVMSGFACGDSELERELPADLPRGRLQAEIAEQSTEIEAQVLAWRRDIHQHPELSNREFRTAALVTRELERLGLVVRTDIAHTGVVGLLPGPQTGPVVALRADMDALPVTEETGLPFASKERAEYLGRDVGVMHACGHDVHTAILLGVAETLSRLKDALRGSVLFVFQPAEEGAPPGERGGARLMLEEGVFDLARPDAMFALHAVPQHAAGSIGYVARGAMASSDRLNIWVRGSQTHAAYPWLGVDSVALAARMVLALQAIPARRVDTRIPSVVSVAMLHGGVRHNIIPEEVELGGTIRALDPQVQDELHELVHQTVEGIAQSAGAQARVEIKRGYPVTYNDPDLVARALPTLERVAGPGGLIQALPRTGAEDISFFFREVPGFYFWLGIRPPDVAERDAAPNHSPRFFVDESALELGVRALANLVVDYQDQAP